MTSAISGCYVACDCTVQDIGIYVRLKLRLYLRLLSQTTTMSLLMLYPPDPAPSIQSTSSALPSSRISSCDELVSSSTVVPTMFNSNVEVAHFELCPNPRCDISHPHTYTDLRVLPSSSMLDMPIVEIQRTCAAIGLTPIGNRWVVAAQTDKPLQSGMKVRLRSYGVVTLRRVKSTHPNWRVFQCLGHDGIIEAEIVAPAEWFPTWYSKLRCW